MQWAPAAMAFTRSPEEAPTRRRLIQAGLLGGAAMASGLPQALAAAQRYGTTENPLRILILGGTGFIGPHMVREALARGHDVSLFNRGRSNDDIFPDLTTYIGDRNNKLDALEGHEWDAVIDNSGYVPRHVADSARLLADAANHYLFISSISVYDSFGIANDEAAYLPAMKEVLKKSMKLSLDKVDNIVVTGDTATADVTVTLSSSATAEATTRSAVRRTDRRRSSTTVPRRPRRS